MAKAIIFNILKTLGLFFMTVYLSLLITNLIFDYKYTISPTLKLVLYSMIDITVCGIAFMLFLLYKIQKKIQKKNAEFYGYLYSLIIVSALTIYSIIELIIFIN